MKSIDIGKKIIKEKIPLLPKNPGVYKMIGEKGNSLHW